MGKFGIGTRVRVTEVYGGPVPALFIGDEGFVVDISDDQSIVALERNGIRTFYDDELEPIWVQTIEPPVHEVVWTWVYRRLLLLWMKIWSVRGHGIFNDRQTRLVCQCGGIAWRNGSPWDNPGTPWRIEKPDGVCPALGFLFGVQTRLLRKKLAKVELLKRQLARR